MITSVNRKLTRFQYAATRSLLARSALVIVLAAGAIVLGDPATGDATPKKWDPRQTRTAVTPRTNRGIGVRSVIRLVMSYTTGGACLLSGGVLGPPPKRKCSAPPASAPGRTVPPGLPTQLFTPVAMAG